jgi:hypothetical protein
MTMKIKILRNHRDRHIKQAVLMQWEMDMLPILYFMDRKFKLGLAFKMMIKFSNKGLKDIKRKRKIIKNTDIYVHLYYFLKIIKYINI